jgi:transposase InsO family protein
MSIRYEFIKALQLQRASMRTLCREFGISEKTGYKWRQRFLEGGRPALADLSHAPHVAPHQVSRALVDAICACRAEFPKWGPRKLREVLTTREPRVAWPAPSTITSILRREGVPLRPRRTRQTAHTAWASGLTTATAPNHVWAADFKGQFRLRDSSYCFPLTISDLFSRVVIGCTALRSVATDDARRAFERHFREYGLPDVMRTDNGAPFGAPGALGGLSTLSVWWVRLGIRPERIRPGCPQQNGTHERMHRTLKDEATKPASATLAQQQTRFDRWREQFNTVRPHESLGNTPPAQHYTPAPRPYPTRLPVIDYPSTYQVRLVNPNGSFRWHSLRIHLSRVLGGEYIGLQHTSDTEWTIWLGGLQLGIYNTEHLDFTENVQWHCTP